MLKMLHLKHIATSMGEGGVKGDERGKKGGEAGVGGEERGGERRGEGLGGTGMVCIHSVSSSLDNTPKTLYPNEKVIFWDRPFVSSSHPLVVSSSSPRQVVLTHMITPPRLLVSSSFGLLVSPSHHPLLIPPKNPPPFNPIFRGFFHGSGRVVRNKKRANGPRVNYYFWISVSDVR